MIFLRSCRIIYEDLTSRSINQCDGLESLLTMPNITGTDVIILLVCILITIYFMLKVVLLFKKD